MSKDRKKKITGNDKGALTVGGGDFSLSIGTILGKESGGVSGGKPAQESGKAKGKPELKEEKPDAAIAGLSKITLHRQSAGKGGKTVTVLTCSGENVPDPEKLAREMRRALGCGSHVEGGKVILQGDIQERARAWLIEKGAKRVVLGN